MKNKYEMKKKNWGRGEEVEGWIIERGFKENNEKEGVEEIVVRGGRWRKMFKEWSVKKGRGWVIRREKGDEGNMGMLVGRDEIGRGMEVKKVLEKRLEMVGNIDNGWGEEDLVWFKEIDKIGKDVISIEDSIVIGVKDIIVSEIGELDGEELRMEYGELRRIEEVIGREVDESNVEKDGWIKVEIIKVIFKIIEKYMVKELEEIEIEGVKGVLKIKNRNEIGEVIDEGIVLIKGKF